MSSFPILTYHKTHIFMVSLLSTICRVFNIRHSASNYATTHIDTLLISSNQFKCVDGVTTFNVTDIIEGNICMVHYLLVCIKRVGDDLDFNINVEWTNTSTCLSISLDFNLNEYLVVVAILSSRQYIKMHIIGWW